MGGSRAHASHRAISLRNGWDPFYDTSDDILTRNVKAISSFKSERMHKYGLSRRRRILLSKLMGILLDSKAFTLIPDEKDVNSIVLEAQWSIPMKIMRNF